MSLAASALYYYTVSELLEQGSSLNGEHVRVEGQAASDSAVQESAGRILKFTIVDGDGEKGLPVVYQGVVPDSFKPGADVVIEGHLDSDGVFQANTMMAKCPSKYVPLE